MVRRLQLCCRPTPHTCPRPCWQTRRGAFLHWQQPTGASCLAWCPLAPMSSDVAKPLSSSWSACGCPRYANLHAKEGSWCPLATVQSLALALKVSGVAANRALSVSRPGTSAACSVPILLPVARLEVWWQHLPCSQHRMCPLVSMHLAEGGGGGAPGHQG